VHVARLSFRELKTIRGIHIDCSYGAVSDITVRDQSRFVTRPRDWTSVGQNADLFLSIEPTSVREKLHHSKMKSCQQEGTKSVWEQGAEDNIWNYEGVSEGRMEEMI
jgi:hypothetical protein